MLLKGIFERPKYLEEYTMSMDLKIQYYKDVGSPKLINRFNVILIRFWQIFL